MSKRQLLCLIAVWVAVFPSPLLGIPSSWKIFLGIATGFVIFVIAYYARPQDFTSTNSQETESKPFADSHHNE